MPLALPRRVRLRRPSGRLLAGLALLLVVAAAVVAVVNPFGGPAAAGDGTSDNTYPTGLASVVRRSLSSQTQVSGTLGYADASTIVVPAGTTRSNVLQAEQGLASAQASLQAAQATLAADSTALEQAQASLAADQAKQASDCSGDNAAQAGGGSATASAGGCATAHQAVATDQPNVGSARAKVAGDRQAVSAADAQVATAQTSLALLQPSATAYSGTSTFTMLPAVGAIVRRGRQLYAVDGAPVLLLYGSVTAWRAFAAGMSPGPDVAELNDNLRALGYPVSPGDAFTGSTAAAIAALQRAHGLAASGALLLGSVAFEPGAVRVTSVTPTVGAAVQPGAVLGVSSTARTVTIALDATQQSLIKAGDRVTITLPDNNTTPGVVAKVGTVATTPSDSGNPGADSTPTVEVDVTPSDPRATGRLDQAPVDISITTATVANALAVPVDALLALAGGGYAVETVDSAGAHRLVAVETGLFDDTEGLVQVTGAGLAPGQRIVVPGS